MILPSEYESMLLEAETIIERLRNLLREVRPFVDHADNQFVDYPNDLNARIDAEIRRRPNPPADLRPSGRQVQQLVGQQLPEEK